MLNREAFLKNKILAKNSIMYKTSYTIIKWNYSQMHKDALMYKINRYNAPYHQNREQHSHMIILIDVEKNTL